jgi:large subunit ribosomal protein L10
MPNYDLKNEKIEELNQKANEAMSIVIGEYRGLSVEDMCELRKKSRESGVFLKIYKNTLAKRALKGTKFECVNEVLSGPTIIGCAIDEPGAAAKLLSDYAKENETLKLKGVSLGDTLLGPEQVKTVAELPNREQALSMLLGTLQAPVTKLAQTLNQTYSKFAYALVALKDKSN